MKIKGENKIPMEENNPRVIRLVTHADYVNALAARRGAFAARRARNSRYKIERKGLRFSLRDLRLQEAA